MDRTGQRNGAPTGHPTSSLLGWIEYLRTQPVDQGAVEEMNKDLSHLMKIVDRFSKIGSETPLTPRISTK